MIHQLWTFLWFVLTLPAPSSGEASETPARSGGLGSQMPFMEHAA